MKNRKILTNLLHVLLEEWGADEIRSTFEKLVIELESDGRGSDGSAKSRPAKSTRPTAIDIVKGLEIDSDRQAPLTLLAARFDDKNFLPSTADVREFIIMAGERPPTMKNRQDSFRHLLRILLRIPLERLRQVAEAATHAGPAELGPISDAISAAGERLPRRNHEPDS